MYINNNDSKEFPSVGIPVLLNCKTRFEFIHRIVRRIIIMKIMEQVSKAIVNVVELISDGTLSKLIKVAYAT